MKLVRARVTNYKSIDDSGWVDLENVTCLVGKNESGKTAFLQALMKISPAPGVAGDFDLLDYPRKALSRYKEIHAQHPATAVSCEFELDDDEIQQIETEFGKGVLGSRRVTAFKSYDNKRQWNFEVSEQAAVKHLLSGASLPPDVGRTAETVQTVEQLLTTLESLPDKAPSVQSFLEETRKRFEITLANHLISLFNNFVPHFVYFSDYSIMAGRIQVQELRRRRDQKTLSDADRTFLSLLAVAGVKLEDFENLQNYERLKADLEAAGISISDEVFRFWSQNKQLEVEFDISQANPNDPAPLNQGTILHVRIKNNRHRVTVPFDQRSRGFVWFFSFLAYFSQLEGQGRGLVLLLDEPGLSLHAKAQGDFLTFIDERLAPRYQVIYTTHSPFMVDPRRLNRVRTVQDVDGKGTVISSEVLRNDKDTVFPLQAALGYELAQTLFVGPYCLLVEGPSDLIYLQVLSDLCASKGNPSLDPRWVIVPVGGADRLSTFISLLGANKLDVAVMMDVSSKDMRRLEHVQTNTMLKDSNLIPLNEVLGQKEADIEDLFDPDYYLNLVSSAYAEQLRAPLTMDTIPKGSPRIVKRVEAYFKAEEIDGGRFNHYRPAAHLLRQPKLITEIDDNTVGRAVSLFERINGVLSKRLESR